MTERALSPESAKDTISNGRMGEYALSMTQETIPKSPSHLQVAKIFMEYWEVKRALGDTSDEALAAKNRYDEYLSRMDPEEDGPLRVEINNRLNRLFENEVDR